MQRFPRVLAFVATFTASAGLLAPPAVLAQPTQTGQPEPTDRIAVGPLQGAESFPPADQEALRERTVDGLRRAGFAVEEGGGADALITPRLRKQGGDYVITADYERNGQVLTTIEDVCELCGIEELGETMASLGPQLQRKLALESDTSMLRVSSTPAGATVRLDEQYIGTTPLDAEVKPGAYVLTVEHDGYRAEERDVELAPAAQATYSLSLRRQLYRRWLPWAALGAGVATAATGIALLAIHDDPIESDCNPDIEGRCQFVHDTLAGGVTMTLLGAGLLVTGTALAIIWREDQRWGRRARISPSPGGLAVRF